MPNEMWYESESGWSGVWIQRGNSTTYDATWTHPTAGKVTATLIITRSGPTVFVRRTDTSGPGTGRGCRYQGVISGNRVSGTYECDWAPGPIPWSATINNASVPLQPWEDPSVRNLIDEWLRQTENCTRRVHPASYIDRWGRICGRLQTVTVDCSQNPDHPPGWDNYRYLWEHNWCPDYFSYTVRDYVRRRQQGASASQLLVCKPGRDFPCR